VNIIFYFILIQSKFIYNVVFDKFDEKIFDFFDLKDIKIYYQCNWLNINHIFIGFEIKICCFVDLLICINIKTNTFQNYFKTTKFYIDM